jgi:hypothetical protein
MAKAYRCSKFAIVFVAVVQMGLAVHDTPADESQKKGNPLEHAAD